MNVESQVYGLVDSFAKSETTGGRKKLEVSRMCFLLDMLIMKSHMGYLGTELT